MMPGTRARTSTSREPAVCPGYSNTTGSDCCCTVVTDTSGGGKPMPGPPFFSEPLEGLHAARMKHSSETTKGALRIGDSGITVALGWYWVVTSMVLMGNIA